MRRDFLLSQLYAFSTVLLWSSAYVFTKVALLHFSFSSLAFLRCAIASLCLAGVLIIKRGPFPGIAALPRFIAAGAAGFALYILAFNKGSALLNPTTSCILISTSPIITALLAQKSFGEKLSRRQWIAIGTAFCGILVMTLRGGVPVISEGILWMLAAAFLISMYNVLQRSLARSYDALAITSYSFFAGTLLLAPFIPEAAGEISSASLAQAGLVCFLGACPSAAAYLLWAKALTLAPKTGNVTNYMFLSPFLSLLLEYIVTGQLPDMGTFVGGGIIIAGLALFTPAGKKAAP